MTEFLGWTVPFKDAAVKALNWLPQQDVHFDVTIVPREQTPHPRLLYQSQPHFILSKYVCARGQYPIGNIQGLRLISRFLLRSQKTSFYFQAQLTSKQLLHAQTYNINSGFYFFKYSYSDSHVCMNLTVFSACLTRWCGSAYVHVCECLQTLFP